MFSAKNRIRWMLGMTAMVTWAATLLSLIAINRMIFKVDLLVSKDAAIVELGERINIRMLEARRDEKNFVIYFDSTYLVQNRVKIQQIVNDIQHAHAIAGVHEVTLDSLEIMIQAYDVAMNDLSRSYQEDPRALYRLQDQMREYDKELQGLVQKRKLQVQDFPSLNMDFSVPLLSAAMKVSSDQARLFTQLRETSSQVQRLAQKISTDARELLAYDASMSVQYGLRAQKWIFIFLILAAIVLLALIYIIPKSIFQRFEHLNRILKAIGRGEIDTDLPVNQTGDEVDQLSESFSEAINKLKYFNALKTERIIEIERNLRRIIDEVDESVLILSEELKITHVNRAAQTLFNVTTDVVHHMIRIIPPLWENLGEQLEQIEKSGRIEQYVKLRKKDLKKYHVTIMPIMGISNKMESVVIFIR